MKKYLTIGRKAVIHPLNDNENYKEWKSRKLRITHIARSTEEHPGYDNSLNEALCDFEDAETGEEMPFSLYEYEFKLI